MKPNEIHTLGIEELRKILKSKDRKSRKTAWDRFSNAFNIATQTYDLVLKHTKLDSIRQQAQRNRIVNGITALEVYLKELIVEQADGWEPKGIASLLNEKVTLGRAYEIINDAQISQIELIVHFSSFNSIEAIDTVFSKLKGIEFLKTIKNKDQIKEVVIKRAIDCFLVRNRIVHEQKFKLKNEDISSPTYVAFLALLINNYVVYGTHMSWEISNENN